MDFRRCNSIQRPYLGLWLELYRLDAASGRNHLFPELVDSTDPWQFSNVLVN
jgi:homospermidine synthase